MKVTIKEIAAKAGVGFQTVSSALNGDLRRVSLAKQRMILKLAREMGYHSNLAAKSLRTRKSYAIGILLPSPLDMFYATMVAEFQKLLSETEYTGTFSFWSSYDEVEAATKNILARNVDAIITVEPEYLPDGLTVPVVSYHNDDPRFDLVGYDNHERARLALEHLLSMGHSRIGFFGSSSGLRGRAFLEIMKKQGHEKTARKYMLDFKSGNLLADPGITEKHLLKMMSIKPAPTALLLSSDTIAIEVLQAALRNGIKIPDELSVIGSDNLPLSERLCPRLSTIGCAEKSFAQLMLETVFARLKSPGLARQRHVCKSELIIRESCKKLN